MTECEFSVGEAYGALEKFRYPKILVEGPRGTAKSRSILSFFLGKLLMYPGSRLLLCRRWRTDLTKTILTTLEDEVFPAFGIPCPGGADRTNRSFYKLGNGSMIWPVGIDDGMGILSMGITFAYPAEVLEMTEEMVTDIAGGLRWTRSPENPHLPDYSQMIMDTNPGPPDHWANLRAEPVSDELRRVKTIQEYLRLQDHNYRPAVDPVRRWKRIVTRHQDNPGYWDHDAWDYTPQGRTYITEQLEGYTGHKRERWLNGFWKGAEGSVYPEFSDTLNVWPVFNPPADWPLYFGTDPGFDHPWANLWFTVAPTGELIVCAEIVVSGKGSTEIVADIKALEQRMGWQDREITRYGDPQYSFSSTAMSKKTIAEQWAELGLALHPWPRTGDNMDGMVDAVRTRVNARTLILMDNCPKAISAVQAWSFARNADGTPKGAKGKDAYEEEYKDPNDVIRGIVALNPEFEQSRCVVYE